MFTRRSLLGFVSGAMLLCVAVPAVAQQQIIQNGPPPELRKNLDAFEAAFSSGDAAKYEAMAKTSFTPEYLKKQTPEQRKAEYVKWFAAFGAIKFQQVQRNGMDAPLEVHVKGTVASGTIWIDVDDMSSKLSGVKAEAEKKHNTNTDAHRRH